MFLPIAILAYALNAGSTIIDKVLLKTGLPNPVVYAFFINALGLLAIFLLPFGIQFDFFTLTMSIISGISGFFAILFFFRSLKAGEASVAVPVVGALNPTFSLLLGSIFLGQSFSITQLLGFFVIISGTAVLTYNIWSKKLRLNNQLINMIFSGLLFAIGYLTLKEAFNSSNFLSGLTLSRISAGLFALTLLSVPKIRQQVFFYHGPKMVGKTGLMFIGAQTLGASSGLLLGLATYFANPALVNSLFGVQYLVILLVAMFLASQHRGQLLDEDLSGGIIVQKIIGAVILSVGVYLLSI